MDLRKRNTKTVDVKMGIPEDDLIILEASSKESLDIQEWSYEDNSSSDIEDTIEEEEALEQEMTPEDELMLLSQDMDTNVLELVPEAILSNPDTSVVPDTVPSPEATGSQLRKFYLTKVSSNAPANASLDSDDEDLEYVPVGAYWREVRVGKEYQSDLEVNKSPNQVPDDELMWKPISGLPDDKLESYLKSAFQVMELPSLEMHFGKNVPDDVVALKTLMECRYVTDKAIEKLIEQMQNLKISQEITKKMFANMSASTQLSGGDIHITKKTKK